MKRRTLYVGIYGHVVALDRATGTENWRTKLKSSAFTGVVVDGREIFATAGGEIFCLEAASGSIRWNNKLKGLGSGLITIGLPSGDQRSSVEKRRREQTPAAAAAAG